MNLARFPRRRYTEGFTPIEKASRFSDVLGDPEIYIKRDDLLGLAGGGNKTRKLEFLVAEALNKSMKGEIGKQVDLSDITYDNIVHADFDDKSAVERIKSVVDNSQNFKVDINTLLRSM